MISDKAYIAPGAKIGNNVTIYPFAYIEDDVVIGDDCVIFPYVSIMRGTHMGRGNKVYQNTVLGAERRTSTIRVRRLVWLLATRIYSARMLL